jgi:hypothetical protein
VFSAASTFFQLLLLSAVFLTASTLFSHFHHVQPLVYAWPNMVEVVE